MKAFNGTRRRPIGELVSSFPLTEKSAITGWPRRAQLIRYPDFGRPISLPPSHSLEQWLWEFVARNSGATVLDSHEVPGCLAAAWWRQPPPRFKELLVGSSKPAVCQEKFLRTRTATRPQKTAGSAPDRRQVRTEQPGLWAKRLGAPALLLDHSGPARRPSRRRR